MCYKIPSSFVLIHTLKNTSSCTFLELVDKKMKIEKKISTVYIDVSRSSILSSVAQFPEIFQYTQDKIEKKINSDKFFEDSVIKYFDVNIENESIHNQIIELLES